MIPVLATHALQPGIVRLLNALNKKRARARAARSRVREIYLPPPRHLYLYFLNRKGTPAMCTFYLKEGAVPYLHIRPAVVLLVLSKL